MNINIYVANLAAYNEGELKGKWFELPADLDEIFATIFDSDELDEEGQPHGDWAIHDYEAPFHIGELTDITKLNEIAEKFMQLDKHEIETVGEIVNHGICYDFDDAIDTLEDVNYYHDCRDMGDVAYQFYEETGQLNELERMNSNLANYIDWDAIGRDMDIEGTFIKLTDGTIAEVIV